MKKLNKKGFTLVELLAVIVVLAIIMVIAGGAILNTINDTRRKSFKSTLDVVVNDMKTRITLSKVDSDTSEIICDDTDNQNNIKDCSYVYDISDKDYTMKIESVKGKIADNSDATKPAEYTNDSNGINYYRITLNGKGKFDSLDLNNSNCPIKVNKTVASNCSGAKQITAYVEASTGKLK